ncbi:voltage-gated potassium channel [Piromyces finnis]|uniref:Voltage-gated potassium channel n=1 Tax=Piromyces finnis TaxID=1754191 RepID=A0A1Y1V8V6_9FUNG|nr:voltage-gated potassium channel [Piromyces finnis]|eukprot:ORX49303.1 voltage-gated potassium channel [Piromyces finnis]
MPGTNQPSGFVDKAIHKLYNDKLCSQNKILNIINYFNFFFVIATIYILYVSSLPQYQIEEDDKRLFEILEIIITSYFGIELLIRYILYTFFSVTINDREKEFDKYFHRNVKNDIDYHFITMSGGTGKGVSRSKRQREILTSSFVHYIKFFKSKIEINNLISIIPYFVDKLFPQLLLINNSYINWIPTALRYTRIIRFMYYFGNTRFFTFIKMPSLLKVLKNSGDGFITVTVLVLWSMMFFSSFFFYAETHDCEFDPKTEQFYRQTKDGPKKCLVNSIIDSYWWGLVTVTCLGYGDTTPVTAPGKVVNGITIIFAIMIFPIPSSILTIEFMEFLVQLKKNETIENAVKECEKKIEKARKKRVKKELKDIISTRAFSNSTNTFLKYYSIHTSAGNPSGLTYLANTRNDPVNITNLFKNDNDVIKEVNENGTSSNDLLYDSTTTIKYSLSKQLLKNKDPEIEELKSIIQDQKNLHKATVSFNKIPKSSKDNEINPAYLSTEFVHNRKNSQGKIEVDMNMGEIKNMTVGEISKELYKLSMEYYAFCDNEISEVDEQTGTLYLLMNGLDKTINLVNALSHKRKSIQ